ncbi:MAG: exodeoxyribonuclease VII large subunit [Dokdonella sp.]
MTPETDDDNARDRKILTPSGLNRLVHDLLEDALPLIWIEGELSNVARPGSGHLYFTLKDSSAQIRCAMFKPRSTWLPFKPADGAQVLAWARVSLYEARGEFQLIVEHMEEAGEGALRREFERLKQKLSAEGLFDADRKRPIPQMPRRIGIITSATGAAVRDVLNVLARRFPLVEVEILSVPVQGKDAPAAIVAMLDAAANTGRYDVLLLTRGGGSLEDLWAFNDEALARAIVRSPVPVVSAVGHEVDFSISDFVADLRAPTPSAAAELLVPDINDLKRRLQHHQDRLLLRLRRRLEASSQRADHLLSRINLQRPTLRLARGRERLKQLQARMLMMLRHDRERRLSRLARNHGRLLAQHPRRQLIAANEHLGALAAQLKNLALQRIERKQARLEQLARALHAVSPLATLGRGYAVLVDRESGAVIHSVTQVTGKSRLRGILADGELGLRLDNSN